MAPLLSAAGVQVTGAGRPGHHYDVAGVTSYVTEPGEFDAALAATDALILACPLTEQTEGLIGAPQLALLRRGAVVVNVSRGAVIDEAALVGGAGERPPRRCLPGRLRDRAAAGQLAAVGPARTC